MISHQSGLSSPFHMEPDADSVSHDSYSKAIQTEIFLHELGHLLGLEHPWDNEDGDFAVQSYEDAHESTRMGYNEHLSGEKKWYEDIDIMALQTIWGESKSTKILDFNEGNGLFMSGKEKLYSLTETIQTFTLFSWKTRIQILQSMALKDGR